MLPAPGQGALAVEVRADDDATASAVAALDDADTRACTTAERVLLADLEAGCSAGRRARRGGRRGRWSGASLRAVVAAADGSVDLRRSLVGDVADPSVLGTASPDSSSPTAPPASSASRRRPPHRPHRHVERAL